MLKYMRVIKGAEAYHQKTARQAIKRETLREAERVAKQQKKT